MLHFWMWNQKSLFFCAFFGNKTEFHQHDVLAKHFTIWKIKKIRRSTCCMNYQNNNSKVSYHYQKVQPCHKCLLCTQTRKGFCDRNHCRENTDGCFRCKSSSTIKCFTLQLMHSRREYLYLEIWEFGTRAVVLILWRTYSPTITEKACRLTVSVAVLWSWGYGFQPRLHWEGHSV